MAESPKLLHSSAMDLWTRLWGIYHVPQNVFLVCNNSTTVRPIATRFCRNMQIVALNRSEGENLHILKIQDGGKPPYWKSIICNNSAIVLPIATKFCRNMQIVALNRPNRENLHILKIRDDGRPPYWKSKIGNICATIQPIAPKFCSNIQIRALNRGEKWKFAYFKNSSWWTAAILEIDNYLPHSYSI